MLRSLEELEGYTLLATDGELGRIKDFLFDDRGWTVRYLVADTGKWLPGRKVLIYPVFVDEPDTDSKRLPVGLTRKTIEESPALATRAPVSRQKERELLAYYRLQPYWIGPHLWGPHPTPVIPAPDREARAETEAPPAEEASREHLRSTHEVCGYHVAASDREIGHVQDFIADTATWTIRWIVIDTRNWLPGRKVLVSPAWADSVQWSERQLRVDLTAEQVENSPEFDPATPINIDPEYENRLYDYYGRHQPPQ